MCVAGWGVYGRTGCVWQDGVCVAGQGVRGRMGCAW